MSIAEDMNASPFSAQDTSSQLIEQATWKNGKQHMDVRTVKRRLILANFNVEGMSSAENAQN